MTHRLLIVGISLLLASCTKAPPLPIHGSVGERTLQSAEGDEVELGNLLGHVAIYDFIFTRCAASCPMMTARMAELSSIIRSDQVRFVSISVDPEWDTPAVLRDYRDKVTNDDRWIFLTGSRNVVRDLSVEAFMLAADPPEQDGTGGPIVHSSKFVLVDRQGAIRGYYDALSSEAMDNLRKDARVLLKSKG